MVILFQCACGARVKIKRKGYMNVDVVCATDRDGKKVDHTRNAYTVLHANDGDNGPDGVCVSCAVCGKNLGIVG